MTDSSQAQQQPPVRLGFLGGTGTVTGSRFLLETQNSRVLVDAGLFQGYKQLRLRNRARFPVNPATLDAVVLTHAHLDHSGYLPLLVKEGFHGPVFCTAGTRDLCRILLPDSGRLQEEEANYANRRGYSKHRPALPLYTEEDAVRALGRLEVVPFASEFSAARDVRGKLLPAGHILGAAMAHLFTEGPDILFSGDLGRPHDPFMNAPADPPTAKYVVLESTYGDRRHPAEPPEKALARVILRTFAREGTLLIPAFAVGRTQALLWMIHQLKKDRAIPNLPVYVDSPMAAGATALVEDHQRDHRLSPHETAELLGGVQTTANVEDSKALDRDPTPKIIISASGMATGGRVLHHLKALAPHPQHTVLFSGYQAGGTRGALMVAGAREVKIHGEYVPIRAEVVQLENLSAHADRDELTGWLGRIPSPPQRVFLVHGNPEASDTLRRDIEERLRLPVHIPDHLETVELR